ncbi:MAG: STAS domain-containing protein [Legionellales bacterium]|nr:STAS domain-containing protein [Legionellales bacterium]
MQNFALSVNNDCLIIEGELNFATVSEIAKMATAIFQTQSIAVIDLAKVTFANSAALALLLQWQREATKHSQALVFRHLPHDLYNIAKACDVADLISIEQ